MPQVTACWEMFDLIWCALWGVSKPVRHRTQLCPVHQFLTSAVADLVQNAVKYTRRGSNVEVRGYRCRPRCCRMIVA